MSVEELNPQDPNLVANPQKRRHFRQALGIGLMLLAGGGIAEGSRIGIQQLTRKDKDELDLSDFPMLYAEVDSTIGTYFDEIFANLDSKGLVYENSNYYTHGRNLKEFYETGFKVPNPSLTDRVVTYKLIRGKENGRSYRRVERNTTTHIPPEGTTINTIVSSQSVILLDSKPLGDPQESEEFGLNMLREYNRFVEQENHLRKFFRTHQVIEYR